MPETTTVILEKFKEHKAQARQHETLRSTLVTFTGAGAGAVLGFAGSQGTDQSFKVAASVFLVLMGIFAALMAYKHYERFRYHSSMAKEYDKKLLAISDAVGIANHRELKEGHKRKFGWIVEMRAYVGWILFPSLIAVLGGTLCILQLRAIGVW